MEMSDFTWQHQKYARPEIFAVTYVFAVSGYIYVHIFSIIFRPANIFI